jgi:RNase H-like domain found in reverse transcriptase
LDLTKKTEVWRWEKPQQNAFDKLKWRMCSTPVLRQPNFHHKFYLQTDASTYSVGTVLPQEGEPSWTNKLMRGKPKLHPVAYYSATFTPTEHNYNIYKRELLAIMKALSHWQPYLGWTKEPFTIMMDHANLQYWKSPKNLNWRTARWHADLQEYDYEILYIPGKENTPPDVLSRPPGMNQGKEDNQSITIILSERFRIATIAPEGKTLVPNLEEVK